MAFLTQQTFSELQELQAEQYSSAATLPAGTGEGEPLGALFNATGILGVQQETQISYAASVSRLATSYGADVDSYCNPFGVWRLGAVSSSGSVNASLPSPPTTSQYIPVGTTLQTEDGVQFIVIADTAQPGYNAALNAYVLFAGQSFVAISVVSTTAGVISNVPVDSTFVIYNSPLLASFQFTNPVAFDNGEDTESDAQMKARFTKTTSGQRSGVAAAIEAAVLGVQANLTYSIGDMLASDGTEAEGEFTVIVNVQGQSSGPGGALISAVKAAVAKVRPLGISYDAVAPTLLSVNATYTLTGTPPAGQTQAQFVAATQAALGNFIDAIGLDPGGGATTLSYGRCYAVLFGVPGVTNVDALTLNGEVGSDIVASFATQIVAGTLTPS